MRVWDLGPGRLMVAGAFSDLALHHHPAVQVTVGTQGPLTVTRAGGRRDVCRLVVVGSGVRHAVRSEARSGAVTLYFGLQTPQGVALNAAAHQGVWVVEDSQPLAEATAAALDGDGPRAAADLLVGRLCGRRDVPRSVHPQLRRAIEVVSSRVPSHVDVAAVANAVALSPDYLGRLCKQQTGASLSATIRWARLVAAMGHVIEGRSVTDAAHLAGFADGSHATRVCWEMTGSAPRDLARAVRQS
ncbi:helix-turn-helix domain-containing protein [Mycobacterium paraense]|nr:helix-turn-helix domain-containing protein [Mycobacterium paraense]